MVRTSNDPLDFAGAPPTPRPPAPIRHPLGLPAGSVRSLIALMVAGLVWALVLLAGDKPVELPPYLIYLVFLIMGSFFAAHGHSIAGGTSPEPSPLRLPRGSVRFLLFGGFAAVIAWRIWRVVKFNASPEIIVKLDDPHEHAYLAVGILGGFFVGMLLNRLVGGVFRAPAWYQDILAWISLLAVLGLVVEVVVLLILNPSLGENALNLPRWQTLLSAVISLYFGARSG